MKSTTLLSLFGGTLSLLIAGCSPHKQTETPTQAKDTQSTSECLSIVSWNDLHGQLDPEEVTIDLNKLPAGGVVALADQVAQIRTSGDTLVILDAGDLFTGPMVSTMFEGAPVIDAYKLIGVDAAAIGNHEFDFGPVGYEHVIAKSNLNDSAGPQGPRGALLQRMSEASFKFVSANIRQSNGAPTDWPGHAHSISISRNNFKIGVVGYTTQSTPMTTLKPNVAGLDFSTDAAQRVGAEIRTLREQGHSPVVLLAHASIDGQLSQTLSDIDLASRPGEISKLVRQLGGDTPDLIIAGHRHAWLLGKVQGIPIVSTDHHGVGVARTRFCKKASQEGTRVHLEFIERKVAFSYDPPRTELGAQVANAIAPWLRKMDAQSKTLITEIKKACPTQSPTGSALGEQVARTMIERARQVAPIPENAVVVGLMNSGGLRTPLEAGPIHYNDIFATIPFENTVAVCGTTVGGLKKLLTNALEYGRAGARFPLNVAGAKIALRRNKRSKLELVNVTFDRSAAHDSQGDNAPVWLALSDFILWGGDDFLNGVQCSPSTMSSIRVRDAWRETLAREQKCDGPIANVSLEEEP